MLAVSIYLNALKFSVHPEAIFSSREIDFTWMLCFEWLGYLKNKAVIIPPFSFFNLFIYLFILLLLFFSYSDMQINLYFLYIHSLIFSHSRNSKFNWDVNYNLLLCKNCPNTDQKNSLFGYFLRSVWIK